MRFGLITSTLSSLLFLTPAATSLPSTPAQEPLVRHAGSNRAVSRELFAELEELARIVDISYCVGLAGLGISKPFECLSRCTEFPTFELVTTWNTGPLFSDSCGYIAVSHAPSAPRIVVAFRGTYSLTNTIADLSTIPQEYVPYPGDDTSVSSQPRPKCENCTVHMGFYTSWRHTRSEILPQLADAIAKYPTYNLTLVGHSLGGAVAAIASLEFLARGWDPTVTTFGEPRIGNAALNHYIDARFGLASNSTSIAGGGKTQKYRRVTHIGDPVPLLPLEEWGYEMHAGEIFIAKSALPPEIGDIYHCTGDADPECITGSAGESAVPPLPELQPLVRARPLQEVANEEEASKAGLGGKWIPDRLRLWELLFAHRDYFWRVGLCVPGGDPLGKWGPWAVQE